MILAGDVGGTKTILALVDRDGAGRLSIQQEQIFASGEYPSLEAIMDLFLPPEVTVDAACIGFAGAVVDQRCFATNLTWSLDGASLKQRLQTDKVRLLNDLEAMALGMLHLPAADFVELNPNAQPHTGNMAVIAAGTGLGEAMLYWDGERHHPVATEGGHCSFAPQTPLQEQLLQFLRQRFPTHVSYERILSGAGFSHLYDFVVDSGIAPACPAVPPARIKGTDRNAVISRLGITGEDPACTAALNLFVEVYGAEAGNLALKSLATGGIFIGGGIGPKIRGALENGNLLQNFVAKGRFETLLSTMSVKLALNPKTPLIGAMHYFA